MFNYRQDENVRFRAGDAVVLANGPYEGTTGVFVTLLSNDDAWAEITERGDLARRHPVIWMRHAEEPPGQ